ncbi:MAG: hypothetical protein ACM3MF_09790 [Anaerolineae bacterium]
MIRLSESISPFLRKAWKPALIVVLALLNCFALWNFGLLARDLIAGDRSADELLLKPIYRPLRVPVRPATQLHQAVGRVGSDFAQVYFPAQDVAHMENAFDAGKTLDPWKRPSRYAPFVILACAATLCRFDFGVACVLHILLQLVLLYGLLYWSSRRLGVSEYFLPGVLFANACLFLTPVGLSWFERGQFSLYLAAAYLLLVMGLLRKEPAWVAAAALLAFIKWTSFPPIFVILVIYLLSTRDRNELKSHVLLVSVFGGVVLALLLLPALFVKGTDAFVRGLLVQELEDLPRGVSLLRYVPRLAVKLLPLGTILLGGLVALTRRIDVDWLIPCAAGVVPIRLMYPTRAYEYGPPSVLGFLPLLAAWVVRSHQKELPLRLLLVIAFLLFIVIASFSTRLLPSILAVVQLYMAISLACMLYPLLLALWTRADRGTMLEPASA